MIPLNCVEIGSTFCTQGKQSKTILKFGVRNKLLTKLVACIIGLGGGRRWLLAEGIPGYTDAVLVIPVPQPTRLCTHVYDTGLPGSPRGDHVPY